MIRIIVFWNSYWVLLFGIWGNRLSKSFLVGPPGYSYSLLKSLGVPLFLEPTTTNYRSHEGCGVSVRGLFGFLVPNMSLTGWANDLKGLNDLPYRVEGRAFVEFLRCCGLPPTQINGPS